jgi:hypothetical protein
LLPCLFATGVPVQKFLIIINFPDRKGLQQSLTGKGIHGFFSALGKLSRLMFLTKVMPHKAPSTLPPGLPALFLSNSCALRTVFVRLVR